MQLKDSVIWITGGNSGMGKAAADLFVANGAKVLITARREKEGEEIANALGRNCIFVKADSTNYDELAAAAKVAFDKWGHIDGLLSCAGGSAAGGVVVTEDPDEIEQLFADFQFGLDLNLWGNFYAAQIAATYMNKNEPKGEYGEKGSIILVASMAADKVWFYPAPDAKPSWGMYGYGASKAALLGLTRDLAYTLGACNIRVNCIKPGFIKTPMTFDPAVGWAAGDMLVNGIQNFPHVGGEPEDIAAMAKTIFEDEFVNRTSIAVDGGIIG